MRVQLRQLGVSRGGYFEQSLRAESNPVARRREQRHGLFTLVAVFDVKDTASSEEFADEWEGLAIVVVVSVCLSVYLTLTLPLLDVWHVPLFL